MYCQKTDSFSGEVFKENFTDIFYTNLEQIAFSIAFPIKNSVKRKTSLFVEKKPKAKISLHIKIGDYLSSGDKIGEKESNIHEPHYASVASHLRSTYKCFQAQIKDMRLPQCKSMIGHKPKIMDMGRYAIRARQSRAGALASAYNCTYGAKEICKQIPQVSKSSWHRSVNCKQYPGTPGKGKAKQLQSPRLPAGVKQIVDVRLQIKDLYADTEGKQSKAAQISDLHKEDLYGHQLFFASKFAKARQTLCKSKMMSRQSEALRRRALQSKRSTARALASAYNCTYGAKEICMRIPQVSKSSWHRKCNCKPCLCPCPRPSGKSKANKSKQIDPRTQLNLYGLQLLANRRFAVAKKREPLWFANRRFAFAPPLVKVHGPSSFCKSTVRCIFNMQSRCKDLGTPKGQKNIRTPLVLTSSGRVVMISKNQLVLQKTQPVLFYDSANLHVKKGEFVLQGAPLLTLTHQTLITGDIVQGIPRIEQLFEAFTSPQKGLKDKKRLNVHDTLHSQVRDIFRKNWLKNVLSVAVRKSLEEIGSILLEMIQKVYLSQGVLISDKHIEIIIRQMTSKGQILDSGSTGLLLEEVLPIRQIENANIATPGKKCLYVPSVVGLTAAALTCDSFISAASFQETTRVLSRDAVVGKTDFLRGLKEKVVIGDLISAGTGLDIYFVYTLFSESISYVEPSKTGSQ